MSQGDHSSFLASKITPVSRGRSMKVVQRECRTLSLQHFECRSDIIGFPFCFLFIMRQDGLRE